MFGTFYVDGRQGQASYWDNPVGLEWWTSPGFTRAAFEQGKRPSESWVKPTAQALFAGRAPD